jgi:hypothetical protein
VNKFEVGNHAADFDLRALHDALDEQRVVRQLTWAAVANQVSRRRTRLRPVAPSTITGLKDKRVGEGDGILQMLIWLGRTPESFVPGIPDADAPRFRLPELAPDQILRWDTRALFAALDAQRRDRGLTWAALARELRGFTPGMLTNLSSGPRIGFPPVMRLVRWLEQPAVRFTRISDR